MKRITWHWSAGTHKVSSLDKKHYHFAIDGAGVVHKGDHEPEANLDTSTAYAAHTRGANTGNIGVALCAMHNAKERPFDAGKYPITRNQENALVKLTAELCDTYKIPVTRQTVLSHAEWQPTNGVAQSGKWDISWLPGMDAPIDPVAVGDILRKRVVAEMSPPTAAALVKQEGGLIAALLAFIAALFGKGKK